jgi:hypothetical protein
VHAERNDPATGAEHRFMSSPKKDLLLRYLDAYNRDAMAELGELVEPTYVRHSSGASLTLGKRSMKPT